MKTCDAMQSFDYCDRDWGTSFMSTCLRLVCPTEIASSYIAYDPLRRGDGLPGHPHGRSDCGADAGVRVPDRREFLLDEHGRRRGRGCPFESGCRRWDGDGGPAGRWGVFGVVVGGLAVLCDGYGHTKFNFI